MDEAITVIDISDFPELVRLAEEVQRTAEPRLLKDGDRQVALLSPLPAKARGAPASREGGREDTAADDPFGGIIGIGDAEGCVDDPTDVSQNKHRYLADAFDTPRA
jgi:hypothetical protein